MLQESSNDNDSLKEDIDNDNLKKDDNDNLKKDSEIKKPDVKK